MKLRLRIVAIAVVVGTIAPLLCRGQTVAADRPVTLIRDVPFLFYGGKTGISRPTLQAVPQPGATERGLQFSFGQRDDSSHPSRTHHVIVGALVGAAAGLGLGLIADHTGPNGAPGSGEHLTYTLELCTAPIGLVIGALTGLLIPAH